MADVKVAASETALKMARGDSKGVASKPKPKASRRKQRKADSEDDEFEPECDVVVATKKRKGEDVVPASRSRPKRAAASSSFKEVHTAIEAQYVTPKEEKMAMLEQEALAFTSREKDESRLLIDFAIHDADGEAQPIELVGGQELYATCVVLPNSTSVDKSKGVLCQFMGPILEWGFENYDKGEPSVFIGTGLAYYTLVQPSGKYKKHYNLILEKAILCVEVYRALSPSTGGDPELGLYDLFARVSRSLRSGKQSMSQFFTRDYLIEQGNFIAGQLKALDSNADEEDQLFSGLPAVDALESECSNRTAPIWAADVKPGTLTIKDVSGSNSNGANSGPEEMDLEMGADEKLARHLQEMENRKLASRQNRNQPAGKRGKVYIKINEAEIASDYPLPAYYKAEEETDEYLFFDDDNALLAPHELPRRVLHDWTLYNSDSRLVSLELLPMLSGVETDVEIFGSGTMTEDDGSTFTFDDEEQEASSLAMTTTSSTNGSGTSQVGNGSSQNGNGTPHGIRLYLSAIKEWMIEFGAGIVSMSIRTDGAWYRLGKPSSQYKPWHSPVLRTARLAIEIITMLKLEPRISRLSFSDILKRLIEQLKEDPKFSFIKIADVERYLVVHGQIILQQFAEYPEEQIRRSAFVTGLMTKMEEKRHVKLVVSKKAMIKLGRNLNPRAHLQPDAKKSKPMRATTTALVNRIWSSYYAKYNLRGEIPTEVKDGPVVSKEEKAEEAEDEEDEEEEEDPTPLAPKPYEKKTQQIRLTQAAKKAKAEISKVSVGDAVVVNLDEYIHDSEQLPSMLLVEYLYELKDGTPMLHGRGLIAAEETVLGNAGDEREVFLTSNCADVEVSGVQKVTIVMKRRSEGYTDRKANALNDETDRARAEKREMQGLPKEFFCRAVYSPDKGAFLSLPTEGLGVGNGSCKACILRNEEEKLKSNKLLDGGMFRLEGVEYKIGDYLYMDPTVFETLKNKDEPEAEVIFKGGRNKGLRPYAICQLLSLQKTAKNILSTKMSVQRFYRPDDFGTHRGYTADIHEVYYSEDTATVEISNIRGRCEVLRPGPVLESAVKAGATNLFFCSRFCAPKTGTVKQLPATVRLSSYSRHADINAVAELKAKAKGKEKAVEDEKCPPPSAVTSQENCLSTLDIFAGCGGLSEGLRQAGVALAKWAIEYEHPASEAFKLNHPETDVFCENCNVVLRCIMEQGGDADDCLSTPEAEQMASALGDEKKRLLPRQGEVDFINGGPPCQGFSGMNRFNTGAWSKVQCEMILGFLSYAEYFRPRYFLLENVRNFISFNKGQTFRLTLATLIEMGYQVRFGVLQAGNYGVSQSRKRAFIWAAAPNEILPEWPEPMHVFGSSQLKITLPGGVSYAAVRDSGKGAPLRAMTVKDTIFDLPPVENGASKEDIKYSDPPVSWFQKQIRGDETVLYDHISKEMNELNLERCKRIPKYPGADWRTLPDIKIKLSTGSSVDLIPWCLPNTAARHNQWKGLYGRLDWDGNFPTSVTDPQPMGKVGMCFHPEQDRIVTVRECARSQGFPDNYKFSGNIQSKHRQIGNAVPPPLARALGVMLKEAMRSRAG